MSDELVVSFGLENHKDIVDAYKDIAGYLDSMVSPARSLSRLLSNMARNSERMARALFASMLALRGMANLSPSLPQIPGARGRGGGAANAVPKLPKPPPTFGKALMNALFSSRFTMNNGHLHMMPLVGRSMQALAALGPVGQVASVAALAIGALAMAAKEAAHVLLGASKLSHIGGGTAGQSAVAMRLAGMMGIDPAQFGQEAQGFQDRVMGDWKSLRGARRLGLDTSHFVPGFENPDATKDYIDAIKGVVMHPDKATAERSARDLGLQQFTWMRDLSPGSKKEIFAQGGMFSDMFGPKQRQDAAEYQFTMMKLNGLWQEMVVKVGGPLIGALKPLMPMLTFVANNFQKFSTILVPLSGYLDKATTAWQALIEWLHWGYEQLRKIPALKKVLPEWDLDQKDDKKNKTQEEQLRELQRINDGIRAMSPGMYGGGERARSAIPANASRVAPALNLGAFAL